MWSAASESTPVHSWARREDPNLDRAQFLFLFRLIEGSAHARERREDARKEGGT